MCRGLSVSCWANVGIGLPRVYIPARIVEMSICGQISSLLMNVIRNEVEMPFFGNG